MNAGKFSFALAFTSALITSAANANGTLQRCSEIATQLNQVLPLQASKNVFTRSMNCLSAPPGRDRITVQFRMLFSLPKSKFPIDDFAAARERQLATLCTTPDSQKMIASFDIEFVYYDPSGVYITEVNHRVEDCPK